MHPGSDGHVRVGTLRIAGSQYERPMAQTCKLPVQSGHDALERKDT